MGGIHLLYSTFAFRQELPTLGQDDVTVDPLARVLYYKLEQGTGIDSTNIYNQMGVIYANY
jgi:hypothetical protein